jgi:molybdopterin-guanine dinucleotide biosynthesis protein A
MTIDRAAIAGVILAGGRSTRMGGPEKSLLELGARRLFEHAADRLSPQVAALVLNANGDPARFGESGLEIIADTAGDHAGPLAGVLAAMEWMTEEFPSATHLATAAADTPFFPRDLVARLAMAAGEEAGAIAIAASADGRHPVFALWPVAHAAKLRQFLESGENPKVLAFANRHAVRIVEFAADPALALDPFFNINTPQDLEIARHAAEKAHG